jgi:hypothetical protein
MVQIIRNFEEKQQKSNISWLEDQVRTCEEPDTSAEVLEERRNKLAKGLRYDSWTSLASRHNLTSPRDLLSTDVGQLDTGTRPPLSPGRHHAFLEQLHIAINENYDHDAPEHLAVDLPKDYTQHHRRSSRYRSPRLWRLWYRRYPRWGSCEDDRQWQP